EIPSLRSSVFRTSLRLFTQLAERAVTPFRRRAIRGRLAKSRVRIGRPFASQYLLSHSDLILARSTFDGHSVLQSLHCTQSYITSYIRRLVSSSTGSAPERAMRRAFARARVEFSSSHVTMKRGHI